MVEEFAALCYTLPLKALDLEVGLMARKNLVTLRP